MVLQKVLVILSFLQAVLPSQLIMHSLTPLKILEHVFRKLSLTNGPQNDPYEADFRETMDKRVLQRPYMVGIDRFSWKDL